MLWKILVDSVRPYRDLLLGVVVFQLAQSIANLYLPSLNADLIDNGVANMTNGVPDPDIGHIWRDGGIMLVLTFFQIFCAITAVYFGAKLAMRVGRDLRAQVFARVGSFSEHEVQHFGAPSLITRTTNDVQQVQMLVMMASTFLIAAPFMSIGGVIMALQQDVGLSWIMVVSIPVLLVAVSAIIVRMVPHFRRMQKRIDVINRVLREQLTGIRVVRAFVREPVERARFEKANADVTESALKAGRLMVAMFPVVMLVLNVSSVGVLWFGASRVQSGEMQVGALIAFLTYLMQILMAVMMATFLFVLVPRASVAADRIGEVLGTDSSVVPALNPVTSFAGEGAVELRDVTFSYPGAEKPVLSNISFVAEKGTRTAIVGSTGSGKTTLVNLLPRLYDASSGQVLVDGVDVRDADLDALWSRIGLVPQRPYLFTGTVASNLRYGNPDATDDELWAALEIAQAKKFVEEMPDGLETEVAQGGTTVSGGQRQRLSVARALVRRPEILIFDDSYSALDTATDARLRRALRSSVKDVTIIVVAQRVSSIIDADQILVLDAGEIVARGNHDELLASSETYREIVSTQLRAEEVA
ncbi:MAG: ABC transporter ATP-binding protein [Demequinaceae bacterium]|nr:ABC transporter ATP-binding protein [Demequinaceae bacterium]